MFGTFVEKVIAPDIKISMEELKKYYDDHLGEYTVRERIALGSLVFDKREDAERAIDTLRKGADFRWVQSNADGQVDTNTLERLPHLHGILEISERLDARLRKALYGAVPGDLRLYESPEGKYYALLIQEVAPSQVESFDAVRENILEKVIVQKQNQAVTDWAQKLREVSEVKIYATEAELANSVTR
jgi:hypothetical protein